MKIKILLVLVILLIDFIVYELALPKVYTYANHSYLSTFLMQFFIIIDIVLNYKISKIILQFLGIKKPYVKYIFLSCWLISSWLALYTETIGTNDSGRRCWKLEVCPPSDFDK